MTQANVPSNPIDKFVLDLARTALVNEPAEGIDATVTHSAAGGLIHTKIRLDADLVVIANGDAAALGGGVKLMDFPAGKIAVQAARIAGRFAHSSADMSSTAGEVGLGTTVASGAIATLSTASFEDILEGGSPALGNIGVGATVAFATWDDNRPIAPSSGLAPALFLNAATTFANATASNLIAKAGTEIEVWWIRLEQ